MDALETEHGKCLNMQRIHDEDFLEKAEMIKEQKIALSQLEKSLLEKTHEMSDLLVMVDRQKTEIGKKHALKKYDQFALSTSCFWGSTTGSNITPVVQFQEIFVTKINNG